MPVLTPFKTEIYRIPPKDFVPKIEVAICYLRHGNRYLLLQRAPGTMQEHTWCLPGGKIESGESPVEGLLREVKEEIGIQLDFTQLQKAGKVYGRDLMYDFVLHMYTQEVAEAQNPRLSDEHQNYCWLKKEEILEHPLIRGGREAFFQFILLSNRPKLLRKSFYFIRHGETNVNANPNIKRVNYDLPLNAKGIAQAKAAREITDQFTFKKVWCSPIQRAQQTKELLLEGREIEHCEEARISECDAEVWTKMVKLEEGRSYEVCPSVEDFLFRVIHGVSEALKEEEPPLLVAHGGVHWAICYHMALEDHPWKIGNCELVYFEPVGESEWRGRVIKT